jgi:hypothetical protein
LSVVALTLGDLFLAPGMDLLLEYLSETDPSQLGTPPARKEVVAVLPTVWVREAMSCPMCLNEATGSGVSQGGGSARGSALFTIGGRGGHGSEGARRRRSLPLFFHSRQSKLSHQEPVTRGRDVFSAGPLSAIARRRPVTHGRDVFSPFPRPASCTVSTASLAATACRALPRATRYCSTSPTPAPVLTPAPRPTPAPTPTPATCRTGGGGGLRCWTGQRRDRRRRRQRQRRGCNLEEKRRR